MSLAALILFYPISVVAVGPGLTINSKGVLVSPEVEYVGICLQMRSGSLQSLG